jgi:hypothetical protein
VAVVHHARKGAARLRAGQALRGSSEFYAWGDSNLYLRRVAEELTLTVEQRATASLGGIRLRLQTAGSRLALEVIDEAREPTPSPTISAADKITEVLAAAVTPLKVAALRRACQMRTATLCAALADLVAAGRVRRTADGYASISR